jgi:hypothetical protein
MTEPLIRLRSVADVDVPVLVVLSAMWEAIRDQLPGVPRVTFDLEPGRTSSCNSVEWSTAPIVVIDLKDSTGRKLPAKDVLFILLHLASHAASHEATGSEGRYHDPQFREAARIAGLEVSDRIPGVGYRPEALARGTLSRYRDVTRRLDAALGKWNPDTVRKRSRSPGTYTCSCQPPRRMWMHPGVADKGMVTCGVCGQPFVPASL